MKSTLIFLAAVFATQAVLAQLAIAPGAQLTLSGPVQLTLNNTSFINNGSFDAGTGTVRFTGNGPNSIGGVQPIQFSEMELDKTGSGFVLLLRSINIKDDLLFSDGFLNLNTFNIDLGNTGVIINENDSARVTGINGGEVLRSLDLNAPLQVNPGNLGLFITTTQNLGNTIIHRGHMPQVNNIDNSSSIQRYYGIFPANNVALNATLAFKYNDGELNGLSENSLSLFENDDTGNWNPLGLNRKNTTANFVEKNNIISPGRFTLFSANLALPVHFVAVNAKCESNVVVLNWRTAQEQNIQYYAIERSNDGNTWLAIGQQPPGLTGAAETSYLFKDNNPLPEGYYRVAEHDLDASIHYSSIVRSSCTPFDVFNVYPNPVSDKLFINIVAAGNSTVMVNLFDNKGALVKQQTENVFRGANRLMIEMSRLAKGIYHLSVVWNNGQLKRTTELLKD